jgi:hypothetical protein
MREANLYHTWNHICCLGFKAQQNWYLIHDDFDGKAMQKAHQDRTGEEISNSAQTRKPAHRQTTPTIMASTIERVAYSS